MQKQVKKILAIGAFERDNFGDLLFLRIMQDYIKDKDATITPSSIIFSDMRPINGEIVYPYKLMLDLYDWDAVWVVGGEVGGVGTASALILNSLDESELMYLSLDELDRIAYKKLLSIPENDNNPAYIPNLHEYTRNNEAKLIVNSVGLMNSVDNKNVLKSQIKALSNATVSVRDRGSVEFCKDNGIKHSLSPDIVSSISHFHPIKNDNNVDPHITVQINGQLLGDTDLRKFASSLKYISEDLGAKIILLRAGVTLGHDDREMYDDLTSMFNSLKPKYPIKQFMERDPLNITELIAKSKLCISTSLHCRIVSESYSVPRISLLNKKTSNYVLTWEDGLYPHGVLPENLVSAVDKIRVIIDDPVQNKGRLINKAIKNLDSIFGSIRAMNRDVDWVDHNYRKQNLFIEYATRQKHIIEDIFLRVQEKDSLHNTTVEELKKQISQLKQIIDDRNNHISNLLNSKSYKLGRLIASPYSYFIKLTRRRSKNRGE